MAGLCEIKPSRSFKQGVAPCDLFNKEAYTHSRHIQQMIKDLIGCGMDFSYCNAMQIAKFEFGGDGLSQQSFRKIPIWT